MKKIIIFSALVLTLFAIAFFTQHEVRAKMDIGQCIANCDIEQGICISQCNGNGQCIANCGAAYGRCVARCSSACN